MTVALVITSWIACILAVLLILTAKGKARAEDELLADAEDRNLRRAKALAENANVRPITEAPSFEPIVDLIAANEAARADWSVVETWGDR